MAWRLTELGMGCLRKTWWDCVKNDVKSVGLSLPRGCIGVNGE